MRLRIAVDMDEVIADAASKRLEFYRAEFGTVPESAALAGRKIYDAVPPEHREAMRGYVYRRGFFADLPVIAGSREVLAELAEHHDVFIATAAMEVPDSFGDKFAWLRRHFPFIDPMNIVFCGDKGILAADVLIDDHSFNFRRFGGEGILYTAPHNLHENGFRRVNDWEEVRSLLL